MYGAYLKKNNDLDEKVDEEIINIENQISSECEDENRKKVVDNFKDMNEGSGNLNHQGVWKT